MDSNINQLEQSLGFEEGYINEEIREANRFMSLDDTETLESAIMHMAQRAVDPMVEVGLQEKKIAISGYIVAVIVADAITKHKLREANKQLKELIDMLEKIKEDARA